MDQNGSATTDKRRRRWFGIFRLLLVIQNWVPPSAGIHSPEDAPALQDNLPYTCTTMDGTLLRRFGRRHDDIDITSRVKVGSTAGSLAVVALSLEWSTAQQVHLFPAGLIFSDTGETVLNETISHVSVRVPSDVAFRANRHEPFAPLDIHSDEPCLADAWELGSLVNLTRPFAVHRQQDAVRRALAAQPDPRPLFCPTSLVYFSPPGNDTEPSGPYPSNNHSNSVCSASRSLVLNQAWPEQTPPVEFVRAVLEDVHHFGLRTHLSTLLSTNAATPDYRLRLSQQLYTTHDWVVRTDWLSGTMRGPEFFAAAWHVPELGTRESLPETFNSSLQSPRFLGRGLLPLDRPANISSDFFPPAGLFPFLAAVSGPAQSLGGPLLDSQQLDEAAATVDQNATVLAAILTPSRVGITCLRQTANHSAAAVDTEWIEVFPPVGSPPCTTATRDDIRVQAVLPHAAHVRRNVLYATGTNCAGDLVLLRWTIRLVADATGNCALQQTPTVSTWWRIEAKRMDAVPVRLALAPPLPPPLAVTLPESTNSSNSSSEGELCPTQLAKAARQWRDEREAALWWTPVQFTVQKDFVVVALSGPEGAWLRFIALPTDQLHDGDITPKTERDQLPVYLTVATLAAFGLFFIIICIKPEWAEHRSEMNYKRQ